MEELCHSIGRQNATILTGSSADFSTSLASVPLSSQQPLAETAKDQEDTMKTQNSADSGEESVEATNRQADTEEEHDDAEKSFADVLNEYIPEASVLMRSIRDRKPKGLFVTERFPIGRQIHDLEDDLLQDLLADSNSSTGGDLIIQDVNQYWAEILRSKFPESVKTTFLAEHMVRLDEESLTEASMMQLGKEIGNICPGAKMIVTKYDDERLALDFDFPFRLPKHKGLHIDFLFETTKLERFSSSYSFTGGTRQIIYEKDASNHWRRASHRMSWCQLSNQFCMIKCLSLKLFAHR